MKPQFVSIISAIVNIFLGVTKLAAGFLIGSVSLIADGIHSSMDVISSSITFLGIKKSQKPVDQKHPYGYYKAESLAGLLVAILLSISGFWILYESIRRFFGEQAPSLSLVAIGVVAVCIVATEALARFKFYFGQKFDSISLVADAEHSRADVLSSVGVLIGLFLIRYWPLADAVIAFGVGAYILYEAWELGREITDSLLDVSDSGIEERIKRICQKHEIDIEQLQTRQIGNVVSAELKIQLAPKLKMEKVEQIIKTLEQRLTNNIPKLEHIVIGARAYEAGRSTVLPQWGPSYGEIEGFEKIGPDKRGERIIIPLKRSDTRKRVINEKFGAEHYMIIDEKDNKILLKQIIKNPYWQEGSPHGARFAKAVRADKVLTPEIGPNARQNLENFGIAVQIINREQDLNTIVNLFKN